MEEATSDKCGGYATTPKDKSILTQCVNKVDPGFTFPFIPRPSSPLIMEHTAVSSQSRDTVKKPMTWFAVDNLELFMNVRWIWIA